MNYRVITSISFLLVSISLLSQTILSGTVHVASSEEAVVGANVMVRPLVGKVLLGYAITDENGRYYIEFKSEKDSVLISVSGFNVSSEEIVVRNISQRLNIDVLYAEQEIREATIKADAITRRNDTVTYYVPSVIEPMDRSIGDVIKRLLGLEVASDGIIKYNGKPINKFYIEGLDMLGGSYGIATNNVQAKDIAAIEVYENHQPIKILENWIKSGEAALNLKLKSGAKGAWNGVIQAGDGYKPWMWNFLMTPMFFGKSFQTIMTYKTNNIGEDVSKELMSHIERSADVTSLLRIKQPTVPPIAENFYLDNNIHAVSLNTINKLKKGSDLTVNAYYIHDIINSEGSSRTEYFLPNQEPLVISEGIKTTQYKDNVKAQIQYRSNTKERYILNKISYFGKWNSGVGRVINDKNRINQHLSLPTTSFQNNFKVISKLKTWRIDIASNMIYDSRPTHLAIKPNLYLPIFNNNSASDDGITQSVATSNFKTDSRISTSYHTGRWQIDINAGVKYKMDNLSSSMGFSDDSLNNDMRWHRTDFTFGPSASININNGLQISLNLPLDYSILKTEDYILSSDLYKQAFLIKPMLLIRSTLSPNLKLDATASYIENLGGISDTYSGYIVTDYRTILKKQGEITREQRQFYNLNLSYANPLYGLFGSFLTSYNQLNRNTLYGVEYIDILSHIQAYNIDNIQSRLGVEGRISKLFRDISTTVELFGSYNRSWNEYLRQGILMNVTTDILSVGGNVNTKFGENVLVTYNLEYSQNASKIYDDENLSTIRSLRQNMTASFIIAKNLAISISGNHFYNEAVRGSDRNSVFLSASISYKKNRFEYIIEGKNLLNQTSFSSIRYDDIGSYAYYYTLRPISVVAMVRFSLR